MRYSWLAIFGVVTLCGALKAQQAQGPAAPPADPRLDALLLQWQEKMKSVQELSAEVIREKEDYVRRVRTVYEGKAKYKRPNLALLEMRRRDKPNIFEKYIATGNAVYEYNQSSQEIRIHEMHPPKPGQLSDANFLSF